VITEPVIASVAADAALATPGVIRLEVGVTGLMRQLGRHTRARWAGLTPAPSAGVSVELASGEATVHLDVVVAADRTALDIATALQSAVADAVAVNTGVPVSSVSVAIMDITTLPE
jgi:uncharacterized alkaline shock family protein YloU